MNELESRILAVDSAALHARAVEVLQLNVGLRCNMSCTHCHQSSSPARAELMPEAVFAAALALARRLRPRLVDVTGGAPELHPRIREMVGALREAGLEVQLRTNLTALLEPGSADLVERWARLGVRLLASFPSVDPAVTARQRGDEAFAPSLAVLRRLNAAGYGAGNGLRLDLAANPDGAQLPEPGLATRLRGELEARHGVRCDALLVLTNVPIGRFGEQLAAAGTRRAYLELLRAAFNPATLPLLACRTTLAVAWDGTLFDCDFNLGARLPAVGDQRDVRQVGDGIDAIARRRIAFAPHCFACTAQAGSS